MSEQIAKCRVEVFSAPCLFDDNFVNDWTAEGGGTFITDGDIVELKCGGYGDYAALYTFAAAKNTNPNRYLTVRATALTGAHWHVNIYSGETLKVTKTYTDAGVKEIDLYAENGNVHFSYDKVRLEVNGSDSTKYVRFDYIVIGDAAMLVPTTTSDIIDELTVTRPILSRGIAGLKARIFNPDGALTGKVAEHDVILAYLWRDGDAQKKIFGGRVVAPGSDASLDANEYYIMVDAHDHGWELNKPPALVDAVYAATGGKAIIEAAVDKCSYLSKKFVDAANDIVSTHDAEFNEVTPGRVINDISERVVDGDGGVGVDGYVDLAGNVNIFKRGKYNSTVDPLIVLGYRLAVDTNRIINKQKVYGEASRPYPASYDLCESLTPTEGVWSAGVNTVAIDATEKIVGSYSIKGSSTVNGLTITMRFDFNAGYEPDCSYPPLRRYGKVALYIKLNETARSAISVVLIDDAGKHQERPMAATYDEWCSIIVNTGIKNSKEWSPWSGESGFNWAKIDKVELWIRAADYGAPITGVYVDGLHFSGRRFEGEYESTTSQGLYGIRMAEPAVDDALRSDMECLKCATGIVQLYKDPVKTINDLRVAGDSRFQPGYLQHLVSSVDGIDGWFRTIEVKHRVRETYWVTELVLNDEPQEIAYLMGVLFDKVRNVGGGQARIQSTSVALGGGSGLGLGEVGEANIRAGAVAIGKMGDTALARMFASGAVKTAIEAWRHGADLTLIDGGDIYSNTVVVSKLGSDALARLFGSSDIKTAIEAWRHSGDLTLIDGGDIYTGSVTLAKLSFVPLTSIGTVSQIVATINASPEGIKIDADNIKIAGTTEFSSGYDPTTKVAGTGGTYQSAASGARVLIFPDANTAIRIIDDAAADVFKALVGGVDVGDVIIGNYAGNKGLKWDKSAGTFTVRGTLVANDITTGTLPGAVVLDRTTGQGGIPYTESLNLSGSSQNITNAGYVTLCSGTCSSPSNPTTLAELVVTVAWSSGYGNIQVRVNKGGAVIASWTVYMSGDLSGFTTRVLVALNLNGQAMTLTAKKDSADTIVATGYLTVNQIQSHTHGVS